MKTGVYATKVVHIIVIITNLNHSKKIVKKAISNIITRMGSIICMEVNNTINNKCKEKTVVKF